MSGSVKRPNPLPKTINEVHTCTLTPSGKHANSVHADGTLVKGLRSEASPNAFGAGTQDGDNDGPSDVRVYLRRLQRQRWATVCCNYPYCRSFVGL